MRLLINNQCNSTNTTINGDTGADESIKGNQYSNILIEGTALNTFQDIDLGGVTQIDALGFEFTGTATITLTASNTLGGSDFTLIITQNVHFLNDGTGVDNTLITGQGDFLLTGQGDNISVSDFGFLNFRYWRITTDSPIVINHFYLGLSLKLSGVYNMPTPDYNSTDISSLTVGGQSYTTPGIITRNYSSITITDGDGTQYEEYINWWISTNRTKYFLFVLFEDCLTTFPFTPFFARITDRAAPTRDRFHHDWDISIQEVK